MEISEFRKRMRDYVKGEQASLGDEEWWKLVTDLSLQVLAERARVKRERAQDNPVYQAWQARKEQASDVEVHRFSFKGSTMLLARHLVDHHDILPGAVEPWSSGLSQAAWAALDDLHRTAHTASKES